MHQKRLVVRLRPDLLHKPHSRNAAAASQPDEGFGFGKGKEGKDEK